MGSTPPGTGSPPATLMRPALVFVATWLVHSADHVRRGTGTTPDGVLWAGTLAAVLATVALTLVFTAHPAAPMVSTAVFASLAIGVAASHLLPDWGPLSEPLLVDSETNRWAAVAAGLEIAGAAWLAWRAFGVVRASGYRLRTP